METKIRFFAIRALALLGLLIVAGCDDEKSALEMQISEALPIGTPSAEVEVFLKEKRWKYNYIKEYNAFRASLPEEAENLLLRHQIKIYLDESGRVTSIEIEEWTNLL